MMVFVGIAALAILLQSFVLLALYLVARKTSRTVEIAVDDLREALAPITPLVKSTRATLDRVSPRVEAAVNNIVAITEDLRMQSADVHASATEMIGRLRGQVIRVDNLLTGVLDSIDKTAGFVRNAVSLPARQLGGILAALRAITDALRGGAAGQPAMHPGKDEDLFI